MSVETPQEPSSTNPPSCPARRPIVRLFLIPMLIAGGLVGLAIWIGWLTIAPLTLDKAIDQLRKTSGGARTADLLVGPAAKERYLAAQAISVGLRDAMANGMTTSQRIELSDSLLDVLQNHTQLGEGEVQHFVLLALGRLWQAEPGKGPDLSPQATQARQRVIDALVKPSATGRPAYLDATAPADLPAARRAAAQARKAAILALGFMRANPEAAQAVPALIQKLKEDPDVDVRIAAASRLGPLAGAENQQAIDALIQAMRQSDSAHAEVAWNAALSLAQMNRIEAEATLLMLLDRKQLAELRVEDREADPDNPPRRALIEDEVQRFLINAIQAGKGLTKSPAVQERIRQLALSDTSPRVRAAAGAR